ncbi:UNKNOWN [Stylonychia lemnae]|uniref:Right handed beta helix domain-containing protein n=1 Tax=Stylonychia lemnae TaxID=5949 RepID=A0A078AGL0_STYLE|nr:UNKNOWN [Stylonychia lemnae]|eukprot:CDW80961.1 UNKNOWN [Stylonychia lemnae]
MQWRIAILAAYRTYALIRLKKDVQDPQNPEFILKYCRGKTCIFEFLDREIYVDGTQKDTVIQLGTKSHPYSMLDDIFRETFNKLSKIQTNLTIYVKEGSIINLYSQSMPILILNSDIEINISKNQTNTSSDIGFATFNIIEESYEFTRANSGFNPSIYLNGSVIDYDISSKYLDGQLDSVEATATKYKFHVYRSNLKFQDILFIQKDQKVQLTDDALVSGYTNPYRWISFIRCQFSLLTFIIFTNYGTNLLIQNSVIDISQQAFGIFSNFMNCDAYWNEGYSGNLILDQNKFIGQNSVTQISLFEASSYSNFTVIGNTFENAFWRSQARSFSYEAYEDNQQV